MASVLGLSLRVMLFSVILLLGDELSDVYVYRPLERALRRAKL